MTSVVVLGVGTTGRQVVEALLRADPDVEVVAFDRDRQRVRGLPNRVRIAHSAEVAGDVVVIATPVGSHGPIAQRVLASGAHAVSLSDGIDDIRQLADLDTNARLTGRAVVLGAGFAPGLTCLLARLGGDQLDDVHEIAVSKAGTGGPACARQHHRAMKESAWDWDGAWHERRGGSGRDLVWFPPPIGARDSYKAALPSPLLLQRRFPEANRIVARVSATRRDRFTSRLPMLRRPHADGGPGAVRVEVRGRRNGAFETVVHAVAGSPAVTAGSVAALTALSIVGGTQSGAFGLAELDDPRPMLRRLVGDGVRLMTFDGTTSV